MTKNHLKRITAPKTWNVQRKKTKFIARPKPGGQAIEFTIPLSVLLIENLKIFVKRKELAFSLNNKDVLVNGTPRTDGRFPVGLFDVVSIPKLEKSVRLIINQNNKLMAIAVEKKSEQHRVSKITVKKTAPGGKVQIGTLDGRAFIVEPNAPYAPADSLVLELPSQRIVSHLKFGKGAIAFVFKGKHTGAVITIDEIDGNVVTFTEKGHRNSTRKDFIIIIGKELPELHNISP